MLYLYFALAFHGLIWSLTYNPLKLPIINLSLFRPPHPYTDLQEYFMDILEILDYTTVINHYRFIVLRTVLKYKSVIGGRIQFNAGLTM